MTLFFRASRRFFENGAMNEKSAGTFSLSVCVDYFLGFYIFVNANNKSYGISKPVNRSSWGTNAWLQYLSATLYFIKVWRIYLYTCAPHLTLNLCRTYNYEPYPVTSRFSPRNKNIRKSYVRLRFAETYPKRSGLKLPQQTPPQNISHHTSSHGQKQINTITSPQIEHSLTN